MKTWAQKCSCGGVGITHLHAEHHEPIGPADTDPFAGRACPLCGDYVTGVCPQCAPFAIAALARVRDLVADMQGVTGARWWADQLTTALTTPVPADDPEGGAQ